MRRVHKENGDRRAHTRDGDSVGFNKEAIYDKISLIKLGIQDFIYQSCNIPP